MNKKLLALIAATFLLSACSTTSTTVDESAELVEAQNLVKEYNQTTEADHYIDGAIVPLQDATEVADADKKDECVKIIEAEGIDGVHSYLVQNCSGTGDIMEPGDSAGTKCPSLCEISNIDIYQLPEGALNKIDPKLAQQRIEKRIKSGSKGPYSYVIKRSILKQLQKDGATFMRVMYGMKKKEMMLIVYGLDAKGKRTEGKIHIVSGAFGKK